LRFQVLTAVTVKISAFWNVTPCGLVELYRRFVGIFVNYHNTRHSSSQIYSSYNMTLGAGIATRLWAERLRNGLRFPSGASDCSVLRNVQTGSKIRPASSTKATGGSFPGGKAAGAVKLTTHLRLVPRSRIVELYLDSPIRLHGM
jgi:hypothetical protein